MKKIRFDYDITCLKKINKGKIFKVLIIYFEEIMKVAGSTIIFLMLTGYNIPLTYLLASITGVLICVVDYKRIQNNFDYGKISDTLLKNLADSVLSDERLTKSDLMKSYDYVKNTIKKEKTLNDEVKVRSRKKVVDYCMLSEKEKIIVLRQIIEDIESKKHNYTSVNTYILDDEDKEKEQFVKYNKTTNAYSLNKENPVVKKLIKSKK